MASFRQYYLSRRHWSPGSWVYLQYLLTRWVKDCTTMACESWSGVLTPDDTIFLTKYTPCSQKPLSHYAFILMRLWALPSNELRFRVAGSIRLFPQLLCKGEYLGNLWKCSNAFETRRNEEQNFVIRSDDDNSPMANSCIPKNPNWFNGYSSWNWEKAI